MSPSSESFQTSEDLSSLEECSVSQFFSSIPSYPINLQDQNEHVPTSTSPIIDNAPVDISEQLNAASGYGQMLVKHIVWLDALTLILFELDAHDNRM
ncbi:hypothetical protein E3N88_00061 [Mikania micrantha]|uniref:Uncharacterized protein n=1 Tax=Mikania micrantha TaxID=192012 RepID=A0A5N6PX08_9ASTR|nr:hypothetical protein E3N88_00061 [Mikania micrantha]